MDALEKAFKINYTKSLKLTLDKQKTYNLISHLLFGGVDAENTI
jgi:hypothetical protein